MVSRPLGKSRQVEKEGNTEPLSQPSRKTFYCFTLFKYETIGEDEINRQLKLICKKYIYGHEICPSTNEKHLQGFMHLKKPMRITEIKISGKPHLQACNGNEEQNVKYCSKEGSIVKHGFPKPLNLISALRPFQAEIEKLYHTEPDDRTIYWFWEDKGNIGKSAFVKYMVATHGCLFCDGGKKSDLINLVFNADMDNTKCIIWDLPRSSKGSISYATLEAIKNGLICNTKYETGVKVFNSPHVFVFANFEPDDEGKLSRDRWFIRYLDNELDKDDYMKMFE